MIFKKKEKERDLSDARYTDDGHMRNESGTLRTAFQKRDLADRKLQDEISECRHAMGEILNAVVRDLYPCTYRETVFFVDVTPYLRTSGYKLRCNQINGVADKTGDITSGDCLRCKKRCPPSTTMTETVK